MRTIKPYVTKQIISARGKLTVEVNIVDYKGNSSTTIGNSNSANVKRHFKFMLNEAILNAVYKHFWENGNYYIRSGGVNLNDLTNSIEVENYSITYYSDLDLYTFKRVNIKGKYRTQTRRKGRFYRLDDYKVYNSKKINKIDIFV